MRALLRAGADVNGRTEGGSTALMLAAREGRLAACTALLDAGAELEGRDALGVSAVEHARRLRWERVAALLHRRALAKQLD